MRLLLAVTFGISVLSVAHAHGPQCFENEVNPQTHQRYETAAQWQSDVDAWEQRGRGFAGPLNLFWSFTSYVREKKQAESFGSDKAAHCYIGCVIARSTRAEVADYVGWLKEQKDLSDCDPETHFEEADALATSWGGMLEARSREECRAQCVERYGSRTY
ncbi:MAG: hypothetical protein JNJ49_12375 [Bdellovibrionaceae bacterium]|nr:hypothetical protein [Pseudobdellovibrionaceae bacterium]